MLPIAVDILFGLIGYLLALAAIPLAELVAESL